LLLWQSKRSELHVWRQKSNGKLKQKLHNNPGTFREHRSFSVLSKPVDNINRLSDATQNHTRTVNTRKLVKPSKVAVKVVMPRFNEKIGEPLIMKRLVRR